jgi:hypothetical protein
MTDHDLASAFAEQFAPLRMSTPVVAIIGRARRRHRRRHLTALTAACSAVLVALLVTFQAVSPTTALASYGITKQPDGSFAITLRGLADLSALGRQLNRDHVPVSLYSFSYTPQCLRQDHPALARALTVRKSRNPQVASLLVHPAAIPAGQSLGLYVAATSPRGFRPGQTISAAFTGADGKTHTIPLTIAGDFAFNAVFLNARGACA